MPQMTEKWNQLPLERLAINIVCLHIDSSIQSRVVRVV